MYIDLKNTDLKSIFNSGMNMYDYDSLENLAIQLKEAVDSAEYIEVDGRMNLSENEFEKIRYAKSLIEQAINYIIMTIKEKYTNINDNYYCEE